MHSPPPPPRDDLQFSNTTGILQKKSMWFIGVEVEQETSAPSPKKNRGSAPVPKTPSHFRCVVVFSGFLSLLSFVDWDFTLSLPLKHFSFHNVKLYIGCIECISIYLLNFFVINTFSNCNFK